MDEAAFERLIDRKLENYPTKDDLKQEVSVLVTKADLQAEITRLATKEELKAEVAKLATKEELKAEVAKLATKQELRDATADLKHHFNIVGESLQDQSKVVADGVLALGERMDRVSAENQRMLSKHDAQLDRLDIRVTRVETHTGLGPL